MSRLLCLVLTMKDDRHGGFPFPEGQEAIAISQAKAWLFGTRRVPISVHVEVKDENGAWQFSHAIPLESVLIKDGEQKPVVSVCDEPGARGFLIIDLRPLKKKE